MTTPFTGTGYTYVQSGNNYIITFISSYGNITFTGNNFLVKYMVVGGGGGGGVAPSGYNGGGGGGGGGVSLGSFVNNNQNYYVLVAGGGTGASHWVAATPGGASYLSKSSTWTGPDVICVSNGGQPGGTRQGGSSGSGGLGGYPGYNGGGGGGGDSTQTYINANGSYSNNSTLYGGGGGGAQGANQLYVGLGRGGGGNGGTVQVPQSGNGGYNGTGGGGGGGTGGATTSTGGGNGGSGIIILFYYPETKFITYNPNTQINVDLNQIFDPYSGGIQAPQTNYTINGVDLNLIFNPSSLGQSINFNTGYIANGLDLRYIFNKPYTPYYYVDRSLSTYNAVNIRNFGAIPQMACSYDGKYCIAPASSVGQYGGVFISSNTGQTWTVKYPDGNYTTSPTAWNGCSCSSTGQIMIAGSFYKLYKSIDYGSNWSLIYTTPQNNLNYCASNADCSRIYMSTNYKRLICLDGSGNLYYNTISGYDPNGITTNNTGQYVYFTTNGGGVFYSSNYGQTFNQSTTTGNGPYNAWSGIKCDNTGKYVYASEVNSCAIVYSNDYGHNYYYMINPNLINTASILQGCYSITCDGTGNVVTFATFPHQLATTHGGGIYQTQNALIYINNPIIANNTPASITWSVIGNSTAFAQDTYWVSVTSDNNTGRLLVMSTAYEANLSTNGGLYTYNMFT